MDDEVIRLSRISKVYVMGDMSLHALKSVDLSINRGEFVAIMGPSGSGKSTVMNILGCLDLPTDGEYFLLGTEISEMLDDELADIRNRQIGFIFQSFNLLSRQTALENVILPMIYAGIPAVDRMEKALWALEKVGLSDRMGHRPKELSGGQQQRVAIARSLVNDPAIMLADEPTGNLDSRSGEEILALFQDLNDEGKTIILVTHDEDTAEHAKRTVRFKDGHIISDQAVGKRVRAMDILQSMGEGEEAV